MYSVYPVIRWQLLDQPKSKPLSSFTFAAVNEMINWNDFFFYSDENGDEESDEPPVPVVKEIKEKDAFYSKK